jgi:hypothetical protein
VRSATKTLDQLHRISGFLLPSDRLLSSLKIVVAFFRYAVEGVSVENCQSFLCSLSTLFCL